MSETSLPAPIGVGIEIVKRAQLVRRLRSQLVGEDLFSDPAWDMLLELFARELTGATVSGTELAALAHVEMGAARRWLDALQHKGLITRAHAADGEVEVLLSAKGSAQMKRYFAAVATTAIPL